MASDRQEDLRCKQPGCRAVVATATVSDKEWTTGFQLDDSVTDAPGLREFNHVGYFRRAPVTHEEHDGRVVHTIQPAP